MLYGSRKELPPVFFAGDWRVEEVPRNEHFFMNKPVIPTDEGLTLLGRIGIQNTQT